MLPLSVFSSRQFSAANAVTFVVYAALGVVFFLLVSFLQISAGYSPIAAGSASLPVTVLMLLGSARAGELAQRIGPRLPLTLGPLIIAAGMLLMLRINPGDSYISSVLPAVLVFGIGLTLVVAPVTATVMASVDEAHSGVASGINNAVARVAGLLAVAVVPVVAGLTGDSFYIPSKMTHGFHVGMAVCAGLSLIGSSSPGRRSPTTSSTTRRPRAASRKSATTAAASAPPPSAPPASPRRRPPATDAPVDGPKTGLSDGFSARRRGAARRLGASGVSGCGLLEGEAAVDGDGGAGDGGAAGAEEEGDGGGDLVGVEEALEGLAGGEVARDGRSKRRADSARSGVSVEPGATALAVTPRAVEVGGEAADEALDRRLRGAVGGEALHAPRRA